MNLTDVCLTLPLTKIVLTIAAFKSFFNKTLYNCLNPESGWK